jgi:hypothetical protein
MPDIFDFPPESRRRHTRVETLGSVFADFGDEREGSVLNMSLGGFLLRLKWMMNPGSSYFVKLFVNGRVAVVEARVVRVVARPDDFLAGMELIRVAPQGREVLQHFLSSAVGA